MNASRMGWVYLGCHPLVCLRGDKLKDQPDRTLLAVCHTIRWVAEPVAVSRSENSENTVLPGLGLLREVTPE